jgi:hypothetical protein
LKKAVRTAIGCLIAIVLLLARHSGEAQEGPAKYFPETGHYLAEPFLSACEAKGALQTWGPPITEAFDENGHSVQYFRRARMECVPATQGRCEVQLSPLGELLGYRTARTSPVPQSLIRSELCRYYAETGHNVCFSFQDFFLDQGGSDVLGLPISELAFEPGMITQYFQRARIEWHMDAPAGSGTQLGAIGEEHFRARGLDPALLVAVEPGGPGEPSSAGETPGPRLTVGGYVRVRDTEGGGLRFRAGAGLRQETIEMLEDGTVLRVIGGPEIADGYTWWHLDYNGLRGWCADEWLERTEAPSSP